MAGLKNIMLVEDDVMIVELYSTALSRGQYSVETAGSAEELYSKLDQFHPDCILLDLMLPGTSGLEILAELRGNPKYGCQQAKIVMLTNLLEPSVRDKAIKDGADGYVIKSEILPKDLLEIIPSLEENLSGRIEQAEAPNTIPPALTTTQTDVTPTTSATTDDGTPTSPGTPPLTPPPNAA